MRRGSEFSEKTEISMEVVSAAVGKGENIVSFGWEKGPKINIYWTNCFILDKIAQNKMDSRK